MKQGKIKSLFAVTLVLGAWLLIGASSAAAQTLKQTEFPDGTGSIGLPPNWRIDSAYRGSVTCVGPNNSAVILKLPWIVIKPGTSLASLPTARQHAVARSGDIVTALRGVIERRANATLKSVRAAPAPQAIRGVPAYYLLYDFEDSRGVQMTGLGYFTTLEYGGNNEFWELYSSAVIARSDQFPQTVQTMLQMWNSWRPNGNEPRAGSDSALFDQILKDKEISRDRISQQFRKVL